MKLVQSFLPLAEVSDNTRASRIRNRIPLPFPYIPSIIPLPSPDQLFFVFKSGGVDVNFPININVKYTKFFQVCQYSNLTCRAAKDLNLFVKVVTRGSVLALVQTTSCHNLAVDRIKCRKEGSGGLAIIKV